jgi:hypothetical protein
VGNKVGVSYCGRKGHGASTGQCLHLNSDELSAAAVVGDDIDPARIASRRHDVSTHSREPIARVVHADVSGDLGSELHN